MAFKQHLITNWFSPNHPNATQGHTLEDNPPPAFIRQHATVRADDGQVNYSAHVAGLNSAIGELTLYQDNNGDYWINNVAVVAQAQRCGVATKLVWRAIKDHGHIYASNSPIDPGGDDDTRHLSQEGAALVAMLIQRNFMHPTWLRPPVI